MARRSDVVQIMVGNSQGSGFAIARDRVLTALHVIGTVHDGELQLHGDAIRIVAAIEDATGTVIRFPVCACTRDNVVDHDAELDWAAIAIDTEALSGIRIPELGAVPAMDPAARWTTCGFPDGSGEFGELTSGVLRSVDARIGLGSTEQVVLELGSDVPDAAGGVVHGYSGAPVIIDHHVRGLLCQPRQAAGIHAAEDTLYAVPLTLISRRLGLALRRDGLSLDAPPRTEFVGREDVLAEIDRQIAAVIARAPHAGWVMILGGPGTGKSALLAQWLARRDQAARVDTPRHFIQRNTPGSQPQFIAEMLAEQLERRFPAQQEAGARPETRLADLLARISRDELVPQTAVLVIVIDGLDETDPDPAGTALARWLPAPPPRVCFLCATRREQSVDDWLGHLHGGVGWIDLDHQWAQSNRDTVARYWAAAGAKLGLDKDVVRRLTDAADDNILHAVTMREAIESPPPGWSLERLPLKLEVLVGELWERCAAAATLATTVGVLCAAREPLPLDVVGELARWKPTDQSRFLRAARPLLLEGVGGAKPAFQIRHDWIHKKLVEMIPLIAMREHHRTLADGLATWPAPVEPERRRYALRHALSHRAEAGEWAEVWRLAGDLSFVQAKVDEFGAYEAEADLARIAVQCRRSEDRDVRQRLDDLVRALGRESHWLRTAPQTTAGLVWNRLQRAGWTAADMQRWLRVPDDIAFLRVRRGATRESRALVRDLVGHSAWLTGCSAIPGGRRIASVSSDRTLRIWDLDTGRPVTTIEAHTNRVTACAAFRDGLRVVSASDDKTLKVWDIHDLDEPRLVATLDGHSRWVNACAALPDGRVVSASGDGTLKVWDVEAQRAGMTLEGHEGEVRACAVSPDGRRLISASDDTSVKLWDLDTGALLATLNGHSARVTACAVIRDGGRAVSASLDRTLKVWDLEAGHDVATLEGHADGITACAVTPDGQYVVSASSDRTLKLWALATGRAVATLEGHTQEIVACSVTHDGRLLVSASRDQTLKLWDLDEAIAGHDGSRVPSTVERHTGDITACLVTGDGRRAVSVSGDRTAKVWELDTGRLLTTFAGHDNEVAGCAVTPDGRRVLTASWDHTLKLWELETGRLITTFEGHDGGVNGCVIAADHRRVISASHDRTLKIWDLDSDRLIATLEGHTQGVTTCALTPDGRVISASDDRTLRIWKLNDGRPIATLEDHTRGVTACAVMPDGRRVVSGSWDRTLKVWDLSNYRLITTLEGHTGTVEACAPTPDGRHVVSASWDQTIRVWDLETYECVMTHRGPTPYSAVATTGAGIVAGDAFGTVWLLDWPPARVDPSTRGDTFARRPPEPRPPRKHVILFLAANPGGTPRLALDEECAAIESELRAAQDVFDFRSKWAVSISELMHHLHLQPAILHFSGHGNSTDIYLREELHRLPPAHRDVAAMSSAGIALHGEQRRPQHVTAHALSRMIRATAPSVRLVVLNACYSDAMADALADVVDCVVGMRGTIRDDAARVFSSAFYRALSYCRSVDNAVQQAIAELSAWQLPDEQVPVLRSRNGINANRIVFERRDGREP